jgi:hypothetical protein
MDSMEFCGTGLLGGIHKHTWHHHDVGTSRLGTWGPADWRQHAQSAVRILQGNVHGCVHACICHATAYERESCPDVTVEDIHPDLLFSWHACDINLVMSDVFEQWRAKGEQQSWSCMVSNLETEFLLF